MGQSLSLALFQAASNNDVARIKLLLGQGAKLDGKDEENGWSPLHYAVWPGHLPAVRELLVAGADVDARDNQLKTPLHYAVLSGYDNIVQALCNHGASVNAADETGQTALHKAATQGQIHLVEELIARGADVNARLQNGDSAIHLASWKGHPSVLETLLQNGANLDAVNQDGESALHEAAKSGKDDCCRLLMKRGASLSLLNNANCTPADLAQQNSHIGTASLLAPDPDAVIKSKADKEFKKRSASSSAQPSAPSWPSPADSSRVADTGPSSSRVTYPVINPPTPSDKPFIPTEPQKGRRYGLPEDDDSDGWEPQSSGDWEGVEAPARVETQGGRLMERMEEGDEVVEHDPFWMVPGPLKWAAGGIGGILNNVNPFKSPRQALQAQQASASTPNQSLESVLEHKQAAVSQLIHSKESEQLTATQLRKIKEQEAEIAELRQQLSKQNGNASQQPGVKGESQTVTKPEASSSKGRHHIIDLPPAPTPTARLLSDLDLQRVARNYSEKLCEASAGTYYRGNLDGADVAILVPKSRGFLPQAAVKQAADRLAGLKAGLSSERLNHLQAYTNDGCAVFNLHKNGSVEDSLRSRASYSGSAAVSLDWKSRLEIALHTAQGLMDLRKAGLNHSPAALSPSKVLLTEKSGAKLILPSLTTLISGPEESAKLAPYMAPEARRGEQQTSQSDVFSLGLFMLQLVTGSEASGLIQHAESAVRQNRLSSILDPCAEGITSKSASELVNLALRCTAFYPEERPNLEHDVLPVLFNLQEGITASAQSPEDEPPEHLICPITQEVMEKPVILSDGYTYEESAIRKWLSTGKQVSPMTNQPLESLMLTPNYVIKSAASTWRESHPEVSAASRPEQAETVKNNASNARVQGQVDEMNSMLRQAHRNSQPDGERIADAEQGSLTNRSDDSLQIVEEDLPSVPSHTAWDRRQEASSQLQPREYAS